MSKNALQKFALLWLVLTLSACGIGFTDDIDKTPKGLSIGTDEIRLPIGYIVRFQPQLLYKDGSLEPYEKKVEWRSDRPDLANLYVDHANESADNLIQVIQGSGTKDPEIRMKSVDENYEGAFTIQPISASLVEVEVWVEEGGLRARGHFDPMKEELEEFDLDLTYNYHYHSTDTDVFQVDKNGQLEIINDGSATLVLRSQLTTVARVNDFYRSREFKVEVVNGEFHIVEAIKPESLEIVIEPDVTEMPLGRTVKIKMLAHYADGRVQDVSRWSRFNVGYSFVPPIIDDRNSGDFYYVYEGTRVDQVSLNAYFAGTKNSRLLSIKEKVLESLQLSSETNSWKWPKGLQVEVTAEAIYSNSNGTGFDVSTEEGTIWSATPEGILEVDASRKNLFHGLKVGEKATLTATVDGISISQEVEVTEPLLQSIRIDSDSTQVPLGETLALRGTAIYTDREEQIVQSNTVSWSVADKSVATISTDGIVTAVSEGETTVTLKLLETPTGAMEATFDIRVTPAVPTSLEVRTVGGKTDLALGESVGLQVIATYSDNTQQELNNVEVDWGDHDNVISDAGVFTPTNSGTYNIVATYYTSEPSPALTITVTQPDIASVAIKLDASRFPANVTITPELIVKNTKGDVLAENQYAVTWNSTNTSVGEVVDGQLQLKAEGTFTLQASVADKHDVVTLTVTPAGKASISLEESQIDMVVSEERLLGVTYIDNTGNLVAYPNNLSCNSSDVAIADGGVYLSDQRGCPLAATAAGTVELTVDDGAGGDSSVTEIRVTELPALGVYEIGKEYDINSIAEPELDLSGYSHVITGLDENSFFTITVTTADGSQLPNNSRLWVAPKAKVLSGSCRANAAANRSSLGCSIITGNDEDPNTQNGGKLYVGILDSVGNVSYKLKVLQNFYRNEGIPALPKATYIPGETNNHLGVVSSNASISDSTSFYKLDQLQPETRYRVRLFSMGEVVYINLYDNANTLGLNDTLFPAPDDVGNYTAGQEIVYEFNTKPSGPNSLLLKVFGHRHGKIEPGASSKGGATYYIHLEEAQ